MLPSLASRLAWTGVFNPLVDPEHDLEANVQGPQLVDHIVGFRRLVSGRKMNQKHNTHSLLPIPPCNRLHL